MSSLLSPELERLALHALLDDYRMLNFQLFGDSLRPPEFRFGDATTELGSWCSVPPTITLSRRLLLEQPWPILVEVLKHEMAHQFVEQVLGVTDQTAHGPAFARVCRERSIDAAASGMLRSASASDSSIFNKVRRLLSLAESSERHEAEAAAAAAQRLILKYNLQAVEAGEPREYRAVHLGKPSGRVQEAQRSLARVLREFFFVETIWVSAYRPQDGLRGSMLEISGTPANVEMAHYVHDFLLHAAENLWRQHKRACAIRGDRERRRFVAGVMAGFHAKLERERVSAQREGLVWLGDPELKAYFKQRYPKLTTVRYGTSAGTSAHSAGKQAGESLVLHRGMSSGPSGGKPSQLRGG